MLGPVDQRNLARAWTGRLRRLLTGAAPAGKHAANAAHHADERSTRGARVALGRALLVPAGAAQHRVFLVELGHLLILYAVTHLASPTKIYADSADFCGSSPNWRPAWRPATVTRT